MLRLGSLFPYLRKYFVRLFGLSVSYWKKRALCLGKKGVLNLKHSDEEFDEVTDKQKKEIYPYFLQMLRGDEELVLDLGCGPGRFTPDLANFIHGRAIGIDIVSEWFDMAPRSTNVEYKLMTKGHLPLADQSVDIIWICLVLGGLRGNVFRKTIREADRVLKKGGLLFLVENTSRGLREGDWKFRSIQEYQQEFYFFSLSLMHDYYDLEERISILSGRKT